MAGPSVTMMAGACSVSMGSLEVDIENSIRMPNSIGGDKVVFYPCRKHGEQNSPPRKKNMSAHGFPPLRR